MNTRRIRNLRSFLMEVFGTRVHKVGLLGGFTCPNRDGTAGTGGCTFCNPAGSLPASWRSGMSLSEQLDAGCGLVGRRFGVDKFLAYFQDYSTTHDDPGILADLYRQALEHPGIMGLCLCTRPDCLDGPVLDLLEWISKRTFLWVEVGAQTFSDEVLEGMNRCHSSADTLKALRNLNRRGIFSAAHMIIGYPGSPPGQTERDALAVRESGVRGLKLQNLHVIRDTPLADSYLRGDFESLSKEEHINRIIRFLESTDPDVVIQRLTGEACPGLQLAPEWSGDKQMVLRRIREEMARRDTWQGKTLGSTMGDVNAPLDPFPGYWGKRWDPEENWP